ncbi:hypothetical protein CLG96_05975 [Sphingomonas oleivorans]|uniref:HTH cro/C1-type domain-containing protein n=1 Tax=Sphingomonas oleivorans TaxID=1735121 RepID=A0A2T5FZH8_9SPHN|nr:helix-turn-helix transcriptional regulator [Sphingomonas oleivorans]PTQ12111.1 hypothetical protein CLG96_05975 [Sphingomonas oleivorans]
MTLRDYLDSQGETQSGFAARVRTSVPTISRILAGRLRPALALAHRIEAATGGKVPTETWVVGAGVAATGGAATGAGGAGGSEAGGRAA